MKKEKVNKVIKILDMTVTQNHKQKHKQKQRVKKQTKTNCKKQT
jgi:hypothetical protein